MQVPARAPVVTSTPVTPAPVARPSHSATTKAPKKRPKKQVAHRVRPRLEPKAAKVRAVVTPVHRTAAAVTSKSGFSYRTLVFLTMIAIGLLCFTLASLPTAHVRPRPAAHYVATRRLDLGIVGLALLLLAAFTFIATNGS